MSERPQDEDPKPERGTEEPVEGEGVDAGATDDGPQTADGRDADGGAADSGETTADTGPQEAALEQPTADTGDTDSGQQTADAGPHEAALGQPTADPGDADREPRNAETVAPSPRERLGWAAAALLGWGSTFFLMTRDSQLRVGDRHIGVLVGLPLALLGTAGVLGLLGLFREGREQARPLTSTVFARLPGEPWWCAPGYGALVASTLLLVLAGLGGYHNLPLAILLACAALLPAAWRRPGLFVFVVVAAVYLPWLGTWSLTDPWETHYGEVTREILSRDDWISLWWAQEDWFWSKPIWIFWAEALSMALMGIPYEPDHFPLHAEWAIRLPHALLAIGASLATYGAVGRIFGRRAGVLAALALATAPHFFLIAHQAITDMPFVGNMTIALMLLALALADDPEAEVRPYRLGPLVLSARVAVLGVLVLVVGAEALYLVSRNVTFYAGQGFAWHGDEFLFGSAGNAGVPGNAAPRVVGPYLRGILAQPATQGLYWLAGLVGLLWFLRRERTVQGLRMTAFYFFCAMAFMGKGLPGVALPGLVALLYLLASGRWDLLLDGRLRVGRGVLLVPVVGLPWYVAMYIRHGPAFTDRLLVHDHLNRLAAGVHGDKGTIEYFIEQLGFGLFPWIALAPFAVLGWLWLRRLRDTEAGFTVPAGSVGALRAAGVDEEGLEARRRETLVLLGLWFFSAFTLFSAMITKFHHYIFPAVPPAAIASGILLDRMLTEARFASWRPKLAALAAALGAAALVLAVAGLWGDVRGVVPEGLSSAEARDWVLRHPWPRGLVAALGSGGLLAWLFATRWLRPPDCGAWSRLALGLGLAGVLLGASGSLFGLAAGAVLTLLSAWTTLTDEASDAPEAEDAPGERVALGIAAAAGTALAAFVGRDLSWVTTARPQGYERFLHLFVYNYKRPWPEQFDYRPILTGFALVACFVLAATTFARLRRLMVPALLGVTLSLAAWAVDVYLPDLAPHWGQRELVAKYYAERSGPEEPLVAWQMNWKGENFYTGNRVSVFVKLDNKEIREWIAENRGRTAWFILEHGRLGNFRSLVAGRPIEEMTSRRDNNKFVLLRVRL